MSESTSSDLRGRRPRFIAGIYNYCDSRCARCKFTARCMTYQVDKRERDGKVGDLFDDLEDAPPEPPREFAEFVAEAQARALSMTPEEQATIEREDEQRQQSVRDDRLVIAARAYTMSTWNITRALEPIVQARGDPFAIEAVESIGELAGPIGSKVSRAVSSSLCGEAEEDDDFEQDADGSAKVARLAIAESRRAWRVLTDSDRAAADGVPAAMLRVLDQIDAELADRFPRAMAFVRPGFDTDNPP